MFDIDRLLESNQKYIIFMFVSCMKVNAADAPNSTPYYTQTSSEASSERKELYTLLTIGVQRVGGAVPLPFLIFC